jgi:hypothetical protein
MTRTGDVEANAVLEAGGVEIGFSILGETAAPPKALCLAEIPSGQTFQGPGRRNFQGH